MNKKITGQVLAQNLLRLLKQRTNKNQISIQIPKEQVSKINSLNTYAVISSDQSRKLIDIFPKLDRYLNNYHTNYHLWNVQGEDMRDKLDYFYINCFRLHCLLKYQEPCEDVINHLLEIILFRKNWCINGQLIMLMKLLNDQAQKFMKSQNLLKLSENIQIVIEQQMDKMSYFSNDFIIMMKKFFDKFKFKVRKSLIYKIDLIIDQKINEFSTDQIYTLSNMMCKKSIKFYEKLALFENNQIKKKMIYRLIYKKIYFLSKRELKLENIYQIMPGLNTSNERFMLSAAKVINSVGQNQPYVDILGDELTIKKYIINQQFSKTYIDYLFKFIAKGHYKIDLIQVDKIVGFLQKLTDLSVLRQSQSQKDNKIPPEIQWIKVLIIAYNLKFYSQSPSNFQKDLNLIIDYAEKQINYEFIRSHNNFFNYSFKQLYFFKIFLYHQLLAITSSQNKILSKQKVEQMLKYYKTKKYSNKEYEKLIVFFKYVNELIPGVSSASASKNNIIYYDKMEKNDLRKLLANCYEQSSSKIKEISLKEFVDKCFQSFWVYQNVILQPNVDVKYIFVSKESQKIYSAFEVPQNSGLFSRFVNENLQKDSKAFNDFHGKFKIESDLNMYADWKRKYIESKGIKYQFCDNEVIMGEKILDMLYGYLFD